MKRVSIVALSIVLFATIYSWFSYVPNSQRASNVYYFGFLETFLFVIIYVGPIYFLVGLPLSIFLDKSIGKSNRKSKWANYFVGLGLYSLVGILVGIISFYIIGHNIYQMEVISYAIYGFTASNIYFHLALLTSKVNKKQILQ